MGWCAFREWANGSLFGSKCVYDLWHIGAQNSEGAVRWAGVPGRVGGPNLVASTRRKWEGIVRAYRVVWAARIWLHQPEEKNEKRGE